MTGILFDFNGTMVFDALYHDCAWRQFVKEICQRTLEDDELVKCFHGAVNKEIITRLFPLMNAEENKQLSIQKEAMYRELCKRDSEHYQLVSGLRVFLDTLKHYHIPMNIASASIKDNIDFFVENFALHQWFEPNHICFDDGTYVNKVQMFKDAAANMGLTMQDCIVFEDSYSGIQCALEAGAKKIIAIAPVEQQQRFKEMEGIAFVIENYSDERLKQLIEGI